MQSQQELAGFIDSPGRLLATQRTHARGGSPLLPRQAPPDGDFTSSLHVGPSTAVGGTRICRRLIRKSLLNGIPHAYDIAVDGHVLLESTLQCIGFVSGGTRVFEALPCGFHTRRYTVVVPTLFLSLIVPLMKSLHVDPWRTAPRHSGRARHPIKGHHPLAPITGNRPVSSRFRAFCTRNSYFIGLSCSAQKVSARA